MAKIGGAKADAKGGPRRISAGVLLVGGVALLAAVIALILVVADAGDQPPAQAPSYAGIPADWQNRTVLGDPEAPVTVQAWEDFRCPACAAFNQRVKPGLVETYIATGKIKLEFNHLPLQQHEPGASLAAQASECAADQGLFWPYHDRIFQATPGGAPAFTMEKLIDYAVELELDEDTFSQCMTGQTYLSKVMESSQAARDAGLNSTPTVLVDGDPVANSLDFGAVSAAIEDRLAPNN